MGAYFTERLLELKAKYELIGDVRGPGLMIGIELDRPCTELVGQALEKNLLINVTAENVIRLLPALITTEAQADEIISKVTELIADLLMLEKSA